MAKEKGLKSFIGKEVQIYPNDTYSKFGIVESVDEFGIVIKITKADRNSGFSKGYTLFYNHAKQIILKLV